MMCFRDMTFCGSDCAKTDCRRYFGPDQKRAAREWWGGDGAPVAFADLSGRCPEYVAPAEHTDSPVTTDEQKQARSAQREVSND